MPSVIRVQRSKTTLAKRARFKSAVYERSGRRTDPWHEWVVMRSDEVVAKVDHENGHALRPIAATSQGALAVRPVYEVRPRSTQRDDRVLLRGRVTVVPRDPDQFRADIEDIECLLEFDDD